ncbi:MAG: hypothetical protein ACM3YE_12500 [Bacteroidota bacterium]
MRSLLERLNHVDYQRIVWILAAAVTIHNLEEAICPGLVARGPGPAAKDRSI